MMKTPSIKNGRPPTFVDTATGAAELCVSPSVWNEMVRNGELPMPCFMVLSESPRWRWAEVVEWLAPSEPLSDKPMLSEAQRNDPEFLAAFRAAAEQTQREHEQFRADPMLGDSGRSRRGRRVAAAQELKKELGDEWAMMPPKLKSKMISERVES
jgi:hypothetical protein